MELPDAEIADVDLSIMNIMIWFMFQDMIQQCSPCSNSSSHNSYYDQSEALPKQLNPSALSCRLGEKATTVASVILVKLSFSHLKSKSAGHSSKRWNL